MKLFIITIIMLTVYSQIPKQKEQVLYQDFKNLSKTISVHYANDESMPNVTLLVSTTKSDTAFINRLSVDIGNIFVNFYDLNNDGFDDIIIELADEAGFVPFILINENNIKFKSALLCDTCYVDYSMLEFKIDGEPHKPYAFKDIDDDGINEVIFKHIFIGKKLKKNVIFKLNNKSNFEIIR